MPLSEKRSDIEAQLLMQLRRAEGPYRRALALIEKSVSPTNPTLDEISACLPRLEPLMRQTQEIESELGPCRQRWLQLGVKADNSLKAILDQHQKLLGGLIQQINSLEQQMQSLKTAVKPSVDSFVRHQQMQRAYQHSAR
ncbi:hypothetical protein [Planctomicrobium piriforme]|uniref:FlgN protein n=1 Tax=Planctomicrobium piriforme TaxID=1576369 RepID=A0A1I3HNA1_9PLAN|nr:hypothetical protein [Planctomicrobium piriforme]SFI37093.1 hypothetical protein SAMN05421753_108128 [Planctomicrobium piriforme]